MKTIKYFAGIILLIAFTCCEKKLDSYYNLGSGLNFVYTTSADTLVTYSFALGPTTTATDTVWLSVETIGPLAATNRQVALEQVHTGTNDAEPGKHYVPFTDANLKQLLVVPAQQSTARLPIILLRDPSLKTKAYNLKLNIKANQAFTFSDPTRVGLRISLTDQLAKPNFWTANTTSVFGAYGPKKHAWLIEQTGNSWDDTYLQELGFTATGTNANFDPQYLLVLRADLKKKLAEYNAQQVAAGKEALQEADGTIVTIPG